MPHDLSFHRMSIAEETSRALAAALAEANLKVEQAGEQLQALQLELASLRTALMKDTTPA